jgi:hypothetical protein
MDFNLVCWCVVGNFRKTKIRWVEPVSSGVLDQPLLELEFALPACILEPATLPNKELEDPDLELYEFDQLWSHCGKIRNDHLSLGLLKFTTLFRVFSLGLAINSTLVQDYYISNSLVLSEESMVHEPPY